MTNAINQIISLFCIVIFGFFIKKRNILDQTTMKKLSHFAVTYLFPASFLVSIMGTDIKTLLDPKFVFALVACLIGTFLVSVICSFIICKDKLERIAFIPMTYVANFVLIGTLMVKNIMGDEYTPYALMGLFFGLFFHNILAITVYESISENNASIGTKVLNVIKNPVIASILIGLVLNLIGIKLGVFEKPLSQLGAMAPVLVLLGIGYDIKFNVDSRTIIKSVWSIIVTLAVIPLVTYLICTFLHIPRELTMVMVILFASPGAPYIYNVMQNYNFRESDFEYAKYMVMFSLIGYFISMPVIMYLFNLN